MTSTETMPANNENISAHRDGSCWAGNSYRPAAVITTFNVAIEEKNNEAETIP